MPKCLYDDDEDFMHRTIKKMQLLKGKSCPLYIYCHGIEKPQYLFENLRFITVERGERPIAYCSARRESLRFDRCFRPFFSHFATMNNFYEVEFTYF